MKKLITGLTIKSKALISEKLGIDSAIVWVVLGRSWSIIAGPISLLLISEKLSIDEQGYYYIFNNLISIAMFFELGLGGWILRFTSYEMNKVTMFKHELIGDENSIARLSNIFRFSVRWFSAASLLFFVIVIISGYYFFSSNSKGENIYWQFPLLFIALMAAVDLFISPLFAFIEGSGFVDKIARLNFYRGITSNIVLWVSLIIGFRLMSMSLMFFFSLVTAFLFLIKWKNSFKFLYFQKFNKIDEGFNYKRELLPLQFKTSITVIAGYFTWQTANLILFKLEGPGESAKLGMCISIANMLLAFGMAWINTKVPQMGLLFGANKFIELKTLFSKSLKKVLFVIIFGSAVVLILDILASSFNMPISSRLLKPIDFSIILLSNLFVVIQNSLAVFNRTFKSEPFVKQMIVMGIAMPIVCFFMGKYWSTRGIVLGIAFVNLTIGLLWSLHINNKQNKSIFSEAV